MVAVLLHLSTPTMTECIMYRLMLPLLEIRCAARLPRLPTLTTECSKFVSFVLVMQSQPITDQARGMWCPRLRLEVGLCSEQPSSGVQKWLLSMGNAVSDMA